MPEEILNLGTDSTGAGIPQAPREYNEMLALMHQQTEIMQQILDQGARGEPVKPVGINLSQEILDVLRKMDERQETAGQTPVLSLIYWPSTTMQMSQENLSLKFLRRVRRRGRRSCARTWITSDP